MSNLLERCRTAGPNEAGDILETAFRLLKPAPKRSPDDHDAWCLMHDRFCLLLEVGTEPAFIGAALMLVPEGDEYDMSTVYGVARASININHGPDDGPHYGSNQCGCLSLAILAAVLAAGDVK